MQIETLKAFCDLTETGSFTKTAQLSNVTQSAISQQVTALERQFQSLLVERSKRKLRLTREGEVLYDYSKQIIQTYNALFGKLQELKDIVSGNIQVAAIYSIGLYDLPPFLKKFLRAHPTVNVHVEYCHTQEVYATVLSNAVDVGLVAYPHREPNLQIVPLREEPLVLICHAEHPFAKAKVISLKKLQGQKFIHFQPDLPTRRAIDHVLREAKVTVQSVMELDNIETVKRGVEIDAGVAVVPLPTITQELAKKTLCAVRLEGKPLFRPLAAIHKNNKVISLALKQFLGTLKGNEVSPAVPVR